MTIPRGIIEGLNGSRGAREDQAAAGAVWPAPFFLWPEALSPQSNPNSQVISPHPKRWFLHCSHLVSQLVPQRGSGSNANLSPASCVMQWVQTTWWGTTEPMPRDRYQGQCRYALELPQRARPQGPLCLPLLTVVAGHGAASASYEGRA